MTTTAGGVSLKHRTRRPRSHLRSNPGDRRNSQAAVSTRALLLLEESELHSQQRLERAAIVSKIQTIKNKGNLSPRRKQRQISRLRRQYKDMVSRHHDAWRTIDDRWRALEAASLPIRIERVKVPAGHQRQLVSGE